MKFVIGVCEACGAEYEMPANAKAWHGQCPKKATRGSTPQYVPAKGPELTPKRFQ